MDNGGKVYFRPDNQSSLQNVGDFPIHMSVNTGLSETLLSRAPVDKNKQGYTILTNLTSRGDHVGFTESQNETDLGYSLHYLWETSLGTIHGPERLQNFLLNLYTGQCCQIFSATGSMYILQRSVRFPSPFGLLFCDALSSETITRCRRYDDQ